MAKKDEIFAAASAVEPDAGSQHFNITGTHIAGKHGLDLNIVGPLSAFDEVLGVELSPTVQIDALNGIRASDIETFTGPSGTAVKKDDHGGKEFHCTSGTTSGGYGIIRSKNVIRYRPGQGARIRFTARYGTPAASSTQRAGGVNIGTELSFGYNGLDFGLLHRTSGRPEIQTLTITTPAAGAETLTLTLDGTGYSIDLTSGTAAHNAFEIITDDSFSAAYDGFQNGDTVVFTALSVGPKTGAFTFSSSGAAVGAFVETANGIVVDDTFINQADWNITTLTTANDPFILKPAMGNAYEIVFQYLGYGNITYAIEHPDTGRFLQVHQIKYANTNVVPSLDTPLFKIGWFAASLGTTTDTEIFGASAAGFIDGPIALLRNPISYDNTKTGVDTTLTNIVSIRSRPTFNGYINLHQVSPSLFSVASEGTKPVVAEIIINPILGGEPNWSYYDEGESLVEFDTSATTVSGGESITKIPLGKSDSGMLNLLDFGISLNRTDVLTIAARATSGTTEATGSITWIED